MNNLEAQSSQEFNFPFKPYEIQLNFMKSLYSVLENSKIGIFESPTGTGKSLSMICGVLKFIEDHKKATVSKLENDIQEIQQCLVLSIGKKEDWIEEQYELISQKKLLEELDQKLKSIHDQDQKIRNIRDKVETYQNRRLIPKETLTDQQHFVDESSEYQEDDEFLLAEEDSDSSENEDTSENEREVPLQIFFCSRTHSQLSQLVGEVKSTTYNVTSVSLASRQSYCINSSVNKLRNGNQINEQCLELQKSQSKDTKKDSDGNVVKSKKLTKACPFYKKNLEKLRNMSISKVMDIEELVKVAKTEKSCPYYSSRAAVNFSQLVFVPYQIILNSTTRKQCGIKLKDSIVIIDEAHNLIDTISQIHTSSISLNHLKMVCKQLLDYKNKYSKRFGAKNLLRFNQLIFIAKQLEKFLEENCASFKSFKIYEILSDTSIYSVDLNEIIAFCEKSRLAQKIHGFSKKHEKFQAEEKITEDVKKNATRNLLEQLKRKSKKSSDETLRETQQKESIEHQTNVIRIFIQFLGCLLQRYEGGRILIDSAKEPSMKFLLLDPSSPFEELIKDCRSIVLAGGTMKPTEELIDQLFKKCKNRVETHIYGHVVPRNNCLPIALSHGCSGKEFLFTHANKDSESMIHELAVTAANICKIVPGGIVCFFTSYENLSRFNDYLIKSNIIETIKMKKEVFVEPRSSSAVEKVLKDYSECAKRKTLSINGAIIFSVIGGRLSEGMNFSDDLGRCILVVGLPFPNKSNPDLIEKMNYLNKQSGSSASSDYYENICMKAVNQSIGRAIRHINDFATVLLLDSRFHRQNIVRKLPEWLSQDLLITSSYAKAHLEIAKFFKGK